VGKGGDDPVEEWPGCTIERSYHPLGVVARPFVPSCASGAYSDGSVIDGPRLGIIRNLPYSSKSDSVTTPVVEVEGMFYGLESNQFPLIFGLVENRLTRRPGLPASQPAENDSGAA
jgi:hypothetical protein